MDERRRLFSTEEGVGEVPTHPFQPSVFHGPAFELFRPGDELIQAQRMAQVGFERRHCVICHG